MSFLVYTRFPSVTATDQPQRIETTWEEFVGSLQHQRLADKLAAPMFGPYVLVGPRREDAGVKCLTMAVFDVDQGTALDIAECDRRLEHLGIERVWYSSHSHTPGIHEAFRLILPLAHPLDPRTWKAYRSALLEKFKIPADPKKCSGISHAYFLPSCPVSGEPIFRRCSGREVDLVVATPPQTSRLRPLAASPGINVDSRGATQPFDLTNVLNGLRQKVWGLSRRKSPTDKEKAALLQKLLAGEQLAKHGSRDDTTSKVAGMLAWSFPEEPVEVLCAVMRPSVDAMIADGSKVTQGKVERMLLSSRAKYEEEQQRQAERDRAIEAFMNSITDDLE